MINPKGDKITYRYKPLKFYRLAPGYESYIKKLIRKNKFKLEREESCLLQ